MELPMPLEDVQKMMQYTTCVLSLAHIRCVFELDYTDNAKSYLLCDTVEQREYLWSYLVCESIAELFNVCVVGHYRHDVYKCYYDEHFRYSLCNSIRATLGANRISFDQVRFVKAMPVGMDLYLSLGRTP